MTKVTIKLFATLREKYGKVEVTVECDGSIRGAILEASKILGKEFYLEVFTKKGNFREDRIINVNGRNVKDLMKKGEQIVLDDGDRISIFPPLAGG